MISPAPHALTARRCNIFDSADRALVGTEIPCSGKTPRDRAQRTRQHQITTKRSKTCCQGRVALGLRSTIGLLASSAAIVSGTIRSTERSPPPITLPARVLAAPTLQVCRRKTHCTLGKPTQRKPWMPNRDRAPLIIVFAIAPIHSLFR